MLKLVAVLLLCLTMVWLLYEINLFTIGWMWVPFFVSLTMAGWWIGCIASGLILLWGIRAQALAWVLAFVIAPISAVYYPVTMLPSFLQPLAYAFPTTYIFEGMRALLLAESRNFNLLLIVSLVLNALYLAFGLWFFNFMFERKRNRGFDDLE